MLACADAYEFATQTRPTWANRVRQSRTHEFLTGTHRIRFAELSEFLFRYAKQKLAPVGQTVFGKAEHMSSLQELTVVACGVVNRMSLLVQITKLLAPTRALSTAAPVRSPCRHGCRAHLKPPAVAVALPLFIYRRNPHRRALHHVVAAPAVSAPQHLLGTTRTPEATTICVRFGRTKQRPPVATNTSPCSYPPAALALIVPEAEEPSPLLGEHPKGARFSTEDVLPTAFVPVATQAVRTKPAVSPYTVVVHGPALATSASSLLSNAQEHSCRLSGQSLTIPSQGIGGLSTPFARSRTPFARHRLREASKGYARLAKDAVRFAKDAVRTPSLTRG